jgi:ABC-type transport system involved in multi-copper enzyme maturation permease subunit
VALEGLSPVFVREGVAAARRWPTYAGRVAGPAALLLSLTVVWAAEADQSGPAASLGQLARVGEAFFYAVVGTQLALVLLAAPAYTAGAVCLDKARGTLAHLLVTDLSATEIILGKLGARLLPVLGLVAAGLPILALATLLGGIDPGALLGGLLVTLGVGVLGCALALALSVWADRPHEAALATYLVGAVPLLVLPAWQLLPAGWGIGLPPTWLEKANPFWLAFAPYARPQGVRLEDDLTFLGGCLGLAALSSALAVVTLRRAAQRPVNGTCRRRERARRGTPLYIPSLDFNPILWRELNGRRSSGRVRVAWALYAVTSVGASALTVATAGGGWEELLIAFQYAAGLLLVSVTSVTALFEERVCGSLDVLLATPLPTSAIVWASGGAPSAAPCWWRCSRPS